MAHDLVLLGPALESLELTTGSLQSNIMRRELVAKDVLLDEALQGASTHPEAVS